MSDGMHFCPHAHDYKDLEPQSLGIKKKKSDVYDQSSNIQYVEKATKLAKMEQAGQLPVYLRAGVSAAFL